MEVMKEWAIAVSFSIAYFLGWAIIIYLAIAALPMN
jgi:uncharacterized membrane protein YhdT